MTMPASPHVAVPPIVDKLSLATGCLSQRSRCTELTVVGTNCLSGSRSRSTLLWHQRSKLQQNTEMANEGVSMLETESYTLAIVFLVFLAVFVTVEKVRVAVSFRPAYGTQSDATLPAVAEVATGQLNTATQSWPAGRPLDVHLDVHVYS